MPHSHGRFIFKVWTCAQGVSFQKNHGKCLQVPNLSDQADHQVQFKTNNSCLGYSNTPGQGFLVQCPCFEALHFALQYKLWSTRHSFSFSPTNFFLYLFLSSSSSSLFSPCYFVFMVSWPCCTLESRFIYFYFIFNFSSFLLTPTP